MSKIIFCLLIFSLSVFAEDKVCEDNTQDCVQDQQVIEAQVVQDDFSEEEIQGALGKTEETMNNIGRDIAGSFEEE